MPQLQMLQCVALQQIVFVATCLLVSQVSSQLPPPSKLMPQFVFSPPPNAKLLFNWDDVWQAGYPDSLALLSANQQLIIRVVIGGQLGGGLKRILQFRCPGKSTDEQVDMDSLSGSSLIEQCSLPGSIAFTIHKRASPMSLLEFSSSILTADYVLKMSTSTVAYQNVFKHYLQFRVLVQYSGGQLLSNSLSVWNLDPISSFPAAPPHQSRSFLTSEAIRFLTGADFGPVTAGADSFSSLQFIEPRMISLLGIAPAFLKQRINIGAILNFDSSGCSFVQYRRSTVFVSYDSKFDSRHALLQKLVQLNLRTGLLWYSKCRLSNEIYQFYASRAPWSIGICLAVSVTGQLQPYYKVSTVQARLQSPTDFSYVGCSQPAVKECRLVPDTLSNVTIFYGMDFASLVCPIVCDDSTVVYRFYANEQLLVPPTASDWDAAVGVAGVRIARSANMIELSPTSAKSGVYRCEAGSRKFAFNVQIVAAPSFAPLNSNGAQPLPDTVFLMEGEAVSLTCSAAYSGLNSVAMQGLFYAPSDGLTSLISWTEHNLSSFQQLLDVSSAGLTVRLNSSLSVESDRSLLTMRAVLQSARLTRPPTATIDHRFICKVGVSSSAELADKFGLSVGNSSQPGLVAQTGSNVVHLRRPDWSSFLSIMDQNSCSVQRCNLGLGAVFKFGLTKQYLDYLNKAGVDVLAYLRLDNFLLTDVVSLMRSNTSSLSIMVDNATGLTSLITYEIFPFNLANSFSLEAKRELEKRSYLTPVFNFRYKTSSRINGLKLDSKSRYGQARVALANFDCRADPLCFYSTDFDADSLEGSLSFLNVALDFKPPTQAASQAGVPYLIGVIVICAVVILILAALLVYFTNRSPAKTYHLEEREIGQGHDPTAEARDEKFKEYQRADAESWAVGFANVAFSASSGQISYVAHQGNRESDL